MPPQEEYCFHQRVNLEADYGSLSLVSLPGLPQLLPSYKPRDDRKWLMEVLSHQFPTARILSYQYDFAKPPRTEACWSKFFVEGEYLLYALVHRRKEAAEIDRPIGMGASFIPIAAEFADTFLSSLPVPQLWWLDTQASLYPSLAAQPTLNI